MEELNQNSNRLDPDDNAGHQSASTWGKISEDHDRFYQKAEKYLRAGDLSEAASFFEKALEIDRRPKTIQQAIVVNKKLKNGEIVKALKNNLQEIKEQRKKAKKDATGINSSMSDDERIKEKMARQEYAKKGKKYFLERDFEQAMQCFEKAFPTTVDKEIVDKLFARNNSVRTLFKLIIVVLILGGGGMAAKKLIETKPVAKRKPISVGSPLVEVKTVHPVQRRVQIMAMGTVIPAKEVIIQPQVAGPIMEMNPRFVPGGKFKGGEVLLKIDPRDYQIALNFKKSEMVRAQVEMEVEQSRQTIAKKEWRLLGSEIRTSKAGRDLALRKPFMKTAKAVLASARIGIRKAELDIERTVVTVPFNASVREKFVDLGQQVGPGGRLATLVGTDEFWIQISVPVGQLSWISIPGTNADVGSNVVIIHEMKTTKTQIRRKGRVVRLLANLDPVGRMARILVTVDDPLGLNIGEGKKKPPLLLGAYVNVEIYGPLIENVFEVDRKALRENDRIWIMTPKHKLAIKKVNVVWRRKDDVLVRGIRSGSQIITSRIPAPVAGMVLKLSTVEPANAAKKKK
ncbi:MAG: HlyD family efflux transporter periplasmic adaptor subunit [Proteobacteria bacterium]|nr:HlyD family efflux transporter periplasmic adaptor subunit [Pseudomonadota bacterium]